MIRDFCTLLRTQFQYEIRSKESFSALVFLSLLLTSLMCFGFHMSNIPQNQGLAFFPILLFTVFTITASVCCSKSVEQREDYLALQNLITCGVSGAALYLARLVVNLVMLCAAFLVCVAAAIILLNLNLSQIALPMLLISALTILGSASLLTLTSSFARASSLGGLLVPSISLPLLFPLFASALSALQTSVVENELKLDSISLSLLIGIAAIYFTLGLNLYEFSLRVED